MAHRDVVVVGASAGGVEALRELVHHLPADFPAAVLVVLHLPSSAFSALPAILSRAGALPVFAAEDDLPLKPGAVLVAPPDRHLIVRGDFAALGVGPKENGHRPAIDPLFRSAARWHDSRVIGVILSGTLDDGAAGLWTVSDRGGAALVQDPDEALYDGMPRAALRAVPDAQVAPLSKLARLIDELCREEVADHGEPIGRTLKTEAAIPELDEDALANAARPGRPAAMTCPDCNGAMFELEEGSMLRFRCRVGHAWSMESLLVEQVEEAEEALWAAIRALEEKGALHRRLVDDPSASQGAMVQSYHHERAREAEHAAATLREMLRRPLTHEMVREAPSGRN
jgi:two-component system chemotaxis response regulator CheB